MTWSKDDWVCQICERKTYQPMPHCWVREGLGQEPCPPFIAAKIREADSRGDGPLVNALCWYARAKWGEGLYW